DEAAGDGKSLAEPRLHLLARAHRVDAGDRAARNPLARLQCDAALGHQLEQEARRADRAVRKGAGAAAAGLAPVDTGRHLPGLEAARAPGGDFRTDDEAVIVAEIGDPRD